MPWSTAVLVKLTTFQGPRAPCLAGNPATGDEAQTHEAALTMGTPWGHVGRCNSNGNGRVGPSKADASPNKREAVTIREIIWKRLPSLYIDVPVLRPGTVGAYAIAIVSVGVATVLRLAIDPYLVGAQFVTFFPAIVITTLISGFGAGFFCAVLSTAAADFFVLEPRWSFSFTVEDPANVADLLLFGPLASYCAFLRWPDAHGNRARASGAGLAGQQRSPAVGPRRSSARVVAV